MQALRCLDRLTRVDAPYLFGDQFQLRALVLAALGDKDGAVRQLREAIARGFTFGIHPELFSPLFGYPPFEELIKPKG